MKPSIEPNKAENLHSYEQTFASSTLEDLQKLSPETRDFFGIVLKGEAQEQEQEQERMAS